jgi:hypothetical protein
VSRKKRAPEGNPAPADDRLVLAAVARAALHRAREPQAAPIWAILDHLAVARRSGAARDVRSRLGALCDTGALSSSRQGGVVLWALTPPGEELLRRARRAGEPLELPESPQHRAWRNAQTLAREEIERLRGQVHALLDAAAALLLAGPAAGSDGWLELGEQLRGACRRLGSATHCLYEWQEPDDDAADVDPLDQPPRAGELDERALARRRALRSGRRNVALWREGSGP